MLYSLRQRQRRLFQLFLEKFVQIVRNEHLDYSAEQPADAALVI